MCMQVWLGLFTALLAEPSSLVPAMIIPQSHPNQRTWDTIRRYMYESHESHSLRFIVIGLLIAGASLQN